MLVKLQKLKNYHMSKHDMQHMAPYNNIERDIKTKPTFQPW